MPTYILKEQQGDSFIDHLLNTRGITEKQAFLNPNYIEGVHNPFLLKDMKKTVERINKAVENNEKIGIYSDFDADGIPGAVVLHDFFKKIEYVNTEHYIPHRHKEGFGVHIKAIEEMAERGCALIISIDCGIADVKTAKRAKELGIDFIITDHHTVGEEIPDAYAIVNPKQKDCQYPEKMLCGSGVIFKVVQALCLEPRYNITPGWEKWLLDMVGLATLSDMVPLLGENRIFAHFGLMVIRKTPRIGLVTLFNALKINQRYVTEEDIAFMVTPRINAASRMANPIDAFKLLSTTSETEAREMVNHLNGVNDDRKVQVAHIVKEMKKKIEERGLADKNIIVIGSPDWKPPVLGLVATNIVRDYGKSVFLWGRSDEGVIKGSCRSAEGVDIVKIMSSVPKDVFINFGGHTASGGYAVSDDHIHMFEEYLLKAYEQTHTSNEGVTSVDVFLDKVLDPAEVGRNLWSDIEKMSPFGEANPKPLFILKSIVLQDIKLFGKKKEHIEIILQNPLTGKSTKAIKFFAGDDKVFMEKALVGNTKDVVAHMEKSMFKSYPEYRLRIVDII
jgi:single-stranded-DNA-specific exonuclease